MEIPSTSTDGTFCQFTMRGFAFRGTMNLTYPTRKLGADSALFGEAPQFLEKPGIRDSRASGIEDSRFAGCRQSGNCKRHGNAVVSTRINLRSVESAWRNPQSVGPLLNRSAHALQIFRQRRNAIALFHPQFRRVSNLNSLLRIRS